MLKVIVIGHVGKEPTVGKTKDGKDFASFSIAPIRSKKEVAGGESPWFTIYTYGALAESIANHVHKGSKLHVMGQLVFEKYKDKSGVEREVKKIMYPDVSFLDLKKKEAGVDQESQKDFGLGDEIPF